MTDQTTQQAPTMKLVKTAKVKPVKQDVVDTSEAEVLSVVDTPTTTKTLDLIVETVQSIDAMSRDEAMASVPTLLNDIDRDYFRLGGILSLIQSNGWHLDTGHENFRQYVESKANMQYRKAMYLVGIYNGLSSSGVPWEKVKNLGWTMLKELASILTPENVDEWVEIVSTMTVLQAQEYIKVKSAGIGSGDSADDAAAVDVKKTTTMTFKLHEDQKIAIREALDKNKHEAGTEFDSVALENICIDYLATGSKKVKAVKEVKPLTLEEMMGKVTVEQAIEAFNKAFESEELVLTQN